MPSEESKRIFMILETNFNISLVKGVYLCMIF